MKNIYAQKLAKSVSACAVLLLSFFGSLNVVAQTVVPYSYTGSMQTFTVPTGVTSITIDAGGAQGGGDAQNVTHALGGRVQATYAVTGGQVLNIFVGGAGGDGSTSTATAALGGYNGGGLAGWYSTVPPGYSGGGGGGATDIRVGGTALSNRVLVAGGGGGGGYTTGPLAGGAGGGTTGASGNTGSGISTATGGTPSAGGTGGAFGGQPSGSNGALGVGGAASAGNGIPGGGGGGYYGGGGGGTTGVGPGGAGGGGSSYADPSMTSVTHTQGYNSGSGYVNISYTPPGGTLAFVNGSPQSMPAICQNASATSINSLLTTSDNTSGETLTWTVTSGPSHGTLGGFSTTATSIVGNSTPTGLTYTPTNGYSGSDAFTIQVSNGVNPVTTVVNVTINPLPTVNTISNQTLCAGTNTVAVTPSGTATTYNWTNSNTSINLAASGTGNIASFTATNASNASAISGTITYTPVTGSCSGTTKTFTYTVNPIPALTTANTASTCSGTSPNISLTATAASSFAWTLGTNTGSITGASASSGSSINQTLTDPSNSTAGSIVYAVTPTSTVGSCVGSASNITVTVNPAPTVNTISNQTVCAGFNTTAVTPSGTGTTYNWTNSNTAIGLAASGTGNIAAFSATNSSATNPISGTIVYTPVLGTCSGATTSFSYTMNPGPAVNLAVSPGVIVCANTNLNFTATPVNGGGSPAYQWKKNGISIGGATSSTYTATGGTFATGDFFTVTMTSTTGCGTNTVGSNSATMTVNPIPIVNTVTPQSVCNGSVNAAVTFSGTPSSGVVYSWTNSNTGVGLASASGTGNIGTFTATNGTTSPTSATITVTPSYTFGGVTCTGTNTNYGITVNPTPTYTGSTSATICSGTAPSIGLTANISSTFAWTLGTNTGSITGATASSGSSIAQTLTDPSNSSAGSIVYQVVPTSTGGSCAGSSVNVTVNVNPTPAVTTSTTQSTCSGTSPNISLTASAASTFAWTLGTNTGSISGANTGSGSSITDVLVNPSNSSAGSIIYAVTPTSTVGSCAGSASNITVTVNPIPVNTTASTASTCSGTGPNISLTASTASNFAWTLGTNTGSITGASASSGTTLNQTLTNPSNSSTGSIVYSVTPTSTVGSCAGTASNITVTVNPKPSVTTSASQSVCSGFSPNVSLTASTPSSFAWTLGTNTGGITGASASSGSTINQTLTNPANSAAGSIVYAVVPTSTVGSCTGNATNITVTVNPTPSVTNSSTANDCSGLSPNINLTASIASSFAWTIGSNPGSISGASASSGSTLNQILTNPSASASGTIVYAVTPTSSIGSCVGAASNITITVNPIPTVNAVSNQAVCNTSATTAISFSGVVPGTTYSWTNSNTTIGFASASGTGNIASFTGTNPGSSVLTSNFVVTPTAGGCTGTAGNFSISVNPTLAASVSMSLNASNPICSGTNVTFTATPTNGGASPTYQWLLNGNPVGTNSNTYSNNSLNTSDVVKLTMTSNATCPSPITSNSNSYTASVVPTPVVNTVSSQTVCNGTHTTAITFSGIPTTGTVYSWTNNNTSLGLTASSNTGNIASFTGTNGGSTAASSQIVVTPTYTALGLTCTGTTGNFSITVNPVPNVFPSSSPVVCNGSAAPAVSFTSGVTGAVFAWTNNNTTTFTGLAASGTGNIASFTPGNTTNGPATPVVATVSVVPSYTNNSVTCTGNSVNFTYTDNPVPTVNAVSNQTVCNGSASIPVLFSGNVTGTVYNWSNSTTISAGFPAGTGAGNIASFTASNPGSSQLVATVTVIPSFTNAGLTCTGSSIIFNDTVNPSLNTAVVISANPTGTICGGTPVTFSAAPTNGGTAPQYQWRKNNINTGLNSSTYTDPTLNNADVIKCILTSNALCPVPGVDTSNSITMSVNTPPVISSQALPSSVCAGSNTSFTIAATGAGLQYQWQANGVAISNNSTYSGVTTNTLSITNSSTALNGTQYTCVVTGTCTPGTTSNPVTLTVYSLPSVTSSPVNTSVCVGSNTSFTVASNTPSGQSLQWMVNTGSGYTPLSNGGVYSGVTTTTLSITGATVSMNGYLYECVVTGFCTPTATSNAATLTVNTLPAINTQPVSTNVCAAGNTSFAVAATGSGLTYQWILNGTTTISAINAGSIYSGYSTNTLTITGALAGMNGNTYQCIVSGTCTPPVNSSVATLNVYTPVTSITQPQNSIVCAGNNTTFTVGGTNGAPDTYQWQVNAGGTGFQNVSGASYSGGTTNTLTVNNSSFSMNGNIFRCIISNPCSLTSTTSPATLTVDTLPTIVFQPSPNTVVCAGSNASMHDSAIGTSIFYQWQVNTGSGFNNVSGAFYSGANTTTLNITGATLLMNNYVYRCVVNGYCTPPATTITDTLRVNSLPSISPQPQSSYVVCVGIGPSMSIGATGTGISYQWYGNNGSGFLPLQDTGIITGSATNTLSFSTSYASMNGYTYKCIVSGTCTPAATSSIATLTVNTLPAIVTQPYANTIVCAGSNTSMSTSAIGTSIQYQWKLNGNPITSSGGVYGGFFTNTLTITGATAGMNGNVYTCTASGYCTPAVTTSNDTLRVNTLPSIVVQPINSTICSGNNASFHDSATGTGIHYQWQVNTGSGFNNASGSPYSGDTTTTLTITGATATMNGNLYRCLVTGTCSPNATSSIAILSVNTAPNISTQPGTNGRTAACVGSPAIISVIATGTSITYQWQIDTGAGFANVTGGNYTGMTNATLNILSAQSTMSNYRYRCIISGVCSPSPIYTSTDTLTINILPGFNVQPVNDTLCTGSNAIFASHAKGSNIQYTWFVNAGSGPSQVSNGGVYSGALTDSLIITSAPTYMNGYQFYCVASGTCAPPATSTTAILVVDSAPHITGIPPLFDTVCVGGSIAFPLAVTGTNLQYQWQVNTGGGFVNVVNSSVYSGATSSGLVITGASASMNNYKYQCIISGACTPNATTSPFVLTVNNLPAISVQPVNTPVCVGLNTHFSISASGTNIVYAWQVNNGSGFTTISNGGIYSGATTNVLTLSAVPITMNGYRFRCIISGSCSPADTSVVDTLTIHALPLANIYASGPTAFCPNDSVILHANTGANLVAYQWEVSGSNIVNAINTTYNAHTQGSYTCSITDINGCVATSNAISVALYTPPTSVVTHNTPTTFCAGANVVLNANTNNLAYQWQLNGINILGATSNTYTASSTGAYTLVTINQNFCATVSAITYVIVNPAPPAFITPIGNTSFCHGQSVTLVANTGSNLSYQWYMNGSPIIGVTGSSYTDTTTGVVTVKITDTACSAMSAGTLVTSNAYPPTNISTASGFNVICDSSNLVMQVTTGFSYQWIYNGTNIIGANSSNYSAIAAGVYLVRITSAAGCADTTGLLLTMDTVINPVIVLSGNGQLCIGAFTNIISWYINGTPIPGSAGKQCIIASQPGSYTVQVSDDYTCGNTSQPYTIVTEVPNVNNSNNDIKLYPNPATSVLHIDAAVKVDISVLNLQGQMVLQQNDAKDIDITSLSNGVYMIQVYNQSHILLKTERMVKNGL